MTSRGVGGGKGSVKTISSQYDDWWSRWLLYAQTIDYTRLSTRNETYLWTLTLVGGGSTSANTLGPVNTPRRTCWMLCKRYETYRALKFVIIISLRNAYHARAKNEKNAPMSIMMNNITIINKNDYHYGLSNIIVVRLYQNYNNGYNSARRGGVTTILYM